MRVIFEKGISKELAEFFGSYITNRCLGFCSPREGDLVIPTTPTMIADRILKKVAIYFEDGFEAHGTAYLSKTPIHELIHYLTGNYDEDTVHDITQKVVTELTQILKGKKFSPWTNIHSEEVK